MEQRVQPLVTLQYGATIHAEVIRVDSTSPCYNKGAEYQSDLTWLQLPQSSISYLFAEITRTRKVYSALSSVFRLPCDSPSLCLIRIGGTHKHVGV